MYTVKISFGQKDLDPVILKKVEPGQTLLELALENNIILDHDCGGICHCTTCHVYIERGIEHISQASKREKDFIGQTSNPKSNSRLACQSVLREGKNVIEILIPERES